MESVIYQILHQIGYILLILVVAFVCVAYIKGMMYLHEQKRRRLEKEKRERKRQEESKYGRR